MATKIVTKNSSTASAAPTASDLVQGELAVNVTDKRLYTENASGAIVELGTNPSTIDINAGTIDGAVIGGATPAAITGTAITATGIMTATGTSVFASLDISGDIDVDGTTNLDVVDIDGAVDMASTLTVGGAFTSLGIDDNATSTAITIDSSENVGIGTTSPSKDFVVSNGGAEGFEVDAGALSNLTEVLAYNRSGAVWNALRTGASQHEFYVSGTERMRIDSSGNVGIGNSVPTGKLTISESAGANAPTTVTADNAYLQLGSADFGASNNGKFMIGFGYTGGTANTNAPAYIGFEESSNAGGTKGDLTFLTRDVTTDTAPTERMRIDSSGNLLVGTTVVTSVGKLQLTSSSTYYGFVDRAQVSTGSPAGFFNLAGTLVGSISTTSTATAYNTSSDYRLKENVVPMTGSIDRVKALKPSRFNFIVDSDTTVDGFLAHEAQAVVPECVTGTKDAMRDEEYEVTAAVYEDVTTPAVEAVEGVEAVEAVEAVDAVYNDEGELVSEAVEAVEAVVGVEAVNAQAETTESVLVTEAVMGTRSVPDMQGIDQSKLVPLLVAALQEAIARIETLEAGA